MPKTCIRPVEVLLAGNNAKSAKTNIVSVSNIVREVVYRLDVEIKDRNDIGGRLNALADSLGGIESRISRIISTIEAVAGNYQRTDERAEMRAREFVENL